MVVDREAEIKAFIPIESWTIDAELHKNTDTAPKPTGSLWIKTTTPNLGANWKVKKWNATTKLWETVTAPIYATNQAALYGLDKTGGGVNLAVGALYINYNNAEATDVVGDFTDV